LGTILELLPIGRVESQFRLGQRQFAGGHYIIETDPIVRSITERLVRGLSAAA
jgi:hypothetical protein